MPKKRIITVSKKPSSPSPQRGAAILLDDVRALILAARENVAQSINSALGTQLTSEFGRGFTIKSLWHMIRFAETFPDERIVSAQRRQLSCTHFKATIYLDDPLKRDIYAACRK